ncbi:LpxL/LpxP family Kdo(2)-lipid IV(A) lauroyl/palmitoleoyl acyltransferase [Hahella sp. SMD15-11]|uniref:Lipid A biosynthesis acyltransferase n=1 Tax=Thermohahella caldifontis TaxID=3142973 RepID=A0AB39UVF2_9GAMM
MSEIRARLRREHLHPRYWPTWLGLALLWLAAWLPLRAQYALGRALGRLAMRALPKRRHIADTNLKLCFPELSEPARQALLRKTFESNGIGLFEAARAWFRSPESMRPRTRVEGLEHLKAALQQGKGVILLGGHYSTLDLGGALYTLFAEADVMQRDHDNPVFNLVMTRSRQRLYGTVLNKDDLRGLIRCLRHNRVVWYATDQDYGRQGSVFAPFFGQPAATLTTTARLARRTGAAVVPFSHFREDDDSGYTLHFEPALADYPSGDDVADATRTNQAIERAIRRHPDQYLWMHRRFKTEPDGNNHRRYGGK